jgi:hypothetical protein
MLYSRPQLRLLLALAIILLTGLAVGEWRQGFPDAAERLERFDREQTPLLQSPPPLSAPGAPTSRPAPPPASVSTASPAQAKALDLNRASVDELARLPGLSPALARRIVDERERRGGFDSPEALRGILGLGPKKLAAIRPLITAGN